MAAGTRGEGMSRTAAMDDQEKSDRPIVPQKRANDPDLPGEESAEGRGLAKGNSIQADTSRMQSRSDDVPSGLERVRDAARRDKGLRFTALLHHVTRGALWQAYQGLNPKAAPGVDRVTWQQYGEDLWANLRDLERRLHTGAYRAKPSRRTYIPKPDGRQRPLGIASLEDKIAQAAVVQVLNAIYEVDFRGFSYGFRPGKNCHQALDALAYGITRKKVNWVLDADVRGYFDAIDHGLLLQYVERRIGDPRILRLIRKWLNAGVLEEGKLQKAKEGTPQGATVSPLLANVYLHYVFDLWAHEWRQRHARGEVIIVRYADDFVVGFQYRADAERFHRALLERFEEHRLEIHPEKTRLIEFGRFAARDRQARGQGKPETFDFLGFTHMCSRSRKGGFLLRRRTITKRMRAKLKDLRGQLAKRMHNSVKDNGQWLRSVLRGYYQYYAVPTNLGRLKNFRNELCRAWYKALRRRSQRSRVTWEQMRRWADYWLPQPEYAHPFPEQRMELRLTRGKSPVR
jgi:group II intron reverse transcriptase/maturase